MSQTNLINKEEFNKETQPDGIPFRIGRNKSDLFMPTLLVLLLLLSLQSQAQDTLISADSLPVSQAQPTVGPTVDKRSLLPNRMLVTQRIFWGPKGALRVTNIAPLTPQGRQQELKLRQFMLVTHQATGYVALAGFLLQGLLATKLSHASSADVDQLYQCQRTTATITNIAYGTTALLSLTAPPKLVPNQKKAGGTRLHQYLSIIHLTGFIAANLLANKAGQHTELRPYQTVASFTTLAAFAPALLALKF